MSQQQNIIVVDDEAAARDMIGDYLKMHGFDVTLCDGGKALRAEVEKARPDLVILDLNMPEEDGLSLVRFLKQSGNDPGLAARLLGIHLNTLNSKVKSYGISVTQTSSASEK